MKPTEEELTVMALKYRELVHNDPNETMMYPSYYYAEVKKFLAMWEATREWRAKIEQAESNDLLEALWGGPKTVEDLEREGK